MPSKHTRYCFESADYVVINKVILDTEWKALMKDDVSAEAAVDLFYDGIYDSDCAAVQVLENINIFGSKLSIRSINKSPAMTETFHQDPALPDLLTYEILSCSLEKQEQEILLNACSIGSSHQHVYLPISSSSSILETPVMTENLHQEPTLCDIVTNDDPSCSPERREPEMPLEPCLIASLHQNVCLPSSSSLLKAPVITETEKMSHKYI
ncbi:unnamed protein product [Parnassius apollo]|uniref:(apollo) hypothetical protein n=1 Tax=Parnassius apollo TaxID=110799 RepID=A0A8S3XSH9_PARAO|nr:unnamed protein product [Parnassius apollo]